MLKRILVSGVLGCVVLLLWTFVANVIFGLAGRIEMNRIPNERAVYQLLKESVAAPGAYMANPEFVPGEGFPSGEPVYSIRYSGVGHEAAGRLLVAEIAIAFAASLLAAWLLSMASVGVLARYPAKVLFIIGIGILLAVFGDLPKFGIGGYPARSALLLAGRDVVSWTLVGLAMAWSMRAPGNGVGTT